MVAVNNYYMPDRRRDTEMILTSVITSHIGPLGKVDGINKFLKSSNYSWFLSFPLCSVVIIVTGIKTHDDVCSSLPCLQTILPEVLRISVFTRFTVKTAFV